MRNCHCVCFYLIVFATNCAIANGSEHTLKLLGIARTIFLDCNVADTTNYNRSLIQRSCPGFGTEWILFPDGEEKPHVVHLKNPADLNPRIFDVPDMHENVRFILYTR